MSKEQTKIFRNPESLSMVNFELLENIHQAKYFNIEISALFDKSSGLLDESPCQKPKSVLRISSVSLLDNKEFIDNIKKEAIKFAMMTCKYNIDEFNEEILSIVDKIKEQKDLLQEFKEKLMGGKNV